MLFEKKAQDCIELQEYLRGPFLVMSQLIEHFDIVVPCEKIPLLKQGMIFGLRDVGEGV